MKKITKIACALFAFSSITAIAQNQASTVDQAPNIQKTLSQDNQKTSAIWDIQKNFNITSAASGNVGMAGVVFFNNQYWVSEWASDTILRYSNAGVLVDKFVISGLSATRALSTDGTMIYASNNTTSIFRINPSTKQLATPATITSAGSVMARFCAYDATLNNGAGGFWIGTFGSNIQSISMTGALLSTINASTFARTGVYGATVDYFTAGGPYLWLFDQGGTNTSDLVQLQLPSGVPTGVMHDVYTDISGTHSLTAGLAGGVCATNKVVNGKASIIALNQGTPNNVLIVYELGANTVSINEQSDLSLSIYPNPAQDFVTISIAKNFGSGTYTMLDVTGKMVANGDITSEKTNINIQDMAAGVYVMQVTLDGKKIADQKIVKGH